jgi:hypothetical protein
VTTPPTVDKQPSVRAESLSDDETARFVDVAFVVVPKPTVSAVIVEEAFKMRPRVVVGARYPLPWMVRAENCEA